jgi:phenylalanyl-tRNA synthetase beta chain
MKISFGWLREFIGPRPGTPDPILAGSIVALAEKLPMLGIGVESTRSFGSDWILDLEVTTNRPDCLGHLGVAREVAAAFENELRRPTVTLSETAGPAREAVTIAIEDLGGCARYCGRVIEKVTVRPSPQWLARRLEAVGVRPINNVADVTNYVLMELGHPLHAFDLARLRGPRIIVRRARAGERLKTLDGVDRILAPEDLVIADAERPVALAGVMGGEESEITAATRSVMLESAWFAPIGIRRSAKRHGLHTEASHRFERGADIEMARQAIDRAAELIGELGGGEILAGVIDVYPERKVRPRLALRSSEIRRVLGADIPGDQAVASLGALGFSVEAAGSGEWRVIPPSFRLDVEREVDLIEEVARLYGYDRLPAKVRPAPPSVECDVLREKELAVSAALAALGYRETILPTMVDPGENAGFSDDDPVRLLNPLAQDASSLRATAVPAMLRALRWNLDRGQMDLRLSEAGKVYTASKRTAEGLPAETRVLTLGLSGSVNTAGVQGAAQSTRRPTDVFDLKGDLETLWGLFDLPHLELTEAQSSYYEAGGTARFVLDGRELARFGQIASGAAHEYKLRAAVYLAEINFEALLGMPLRKRTFQPFAKYPVVERDLSLLVPSSVNYRDIEAAVRSVGLEVLREFHVADRFEGGALPPGHYSLLLHTVLQSPERTLTSEEADGAGRKLLDALNALGVQLRAL